MGHGTGVHLEAPPEYERRYLRRLPPATLSAPAVQRPLTKWAVSLTARCNFTPALLSLVSQTLNDIYIARNGSRARTSALLNVS